MITSTDVQGNKYQLAVDDLHWRPAAYAIVVHDGKILLAQQNDSFQLPGGGIELGEKPDEAVVRETGEETGIIVGKPKLVDCLTTFFTYKDVSRDLHHAQSLLLYYQCESLGGELSMDHFMEDEEAPGMPEWVALRDLDTIKAGSTIDWRKVVKKALSST